MYHIVFEMYKFTNTWRYQTNIYVSDAYKYVTAVTKNAQKAHYIYKYISF